MKEMTRKGREGYESTTSIGSSGSSELSDGSDQNTRKITNKQLTEAAIQVINQKVIAHKPANILQRCTNYQSPLQGNPHQIAAVWRNIKDNQGTKIDYLQELLKAFDTVSKNGPEKTKLCQTLESQLLGYILTTEFQFWNDKHFQYEPSNSLPNDKIALLKSVVQCALQYNNQTKFPVPSSVKDPYKRTRAYLKLVVELMAAYDEKKEKKDMVNLIEKAMTSSDFNKSSQTTCLRVLTSQDQVKNSGCLLRNP